METLSFEQIKELIEIATETSNFDYISLVVTSVVPLLAVGVGYFVVNHAVQVINEKVIEKEVEKLFEAVDCFFEYSDTASLYFSMTEKKIENILSQKISEAGFDEKVKVITDAFYENHRQVHKTSFLLRALGQKDVAKKIDGYKDETIRLRKKLIGLLSEYAANNDAKPLKDFAQSLSDQRKGLTKMKDDCVDAMAECKKNLKAAV